MFYPEVNACTCVNFNEDYFRIHNYIYSKGQAVESRVGLTREVLSFKTTITKPTQRCIGGYGRNMNIFFLLAESLWIFAGRKDVKFLTIFNSNMSQFSDDGNVFHAPYGWRLRRWGVESERMHPFKGLDQLLCILQMLQSNPLDRRAVASIWNTDFDLGIKSNDLPCNDLLMFAIRHNENKKPALFLDIANRSNDLNLGLATNVFQFSFLLEIMAAILGVEVGYQTHNSRSLHIYLNHEVTDKVQKNLILDYKGLVYPSNLYYQAMNLLMDFNFPTGSNVEDKYKMITVQVNNIIQFLEHAFENKLSYEEEQLFLQDLYGFSKYLYRVYLLLKVYIRYKHCNDKLIALNDIAQITTIQDEHCDIFVLAFNFFLARLQHKYSFSDFEDLKFSLFKSKSSVLTKDIVKFLAKY